MKKVLAMLKWSMPTNLIELCGFLGLTSYYRTFIANYEVIITTLSDLLKKNIWTEKATKVFERMRHALVIMQISASPDLELPFAVEADVFKTELGTILLNNKNP